VRFESKVKVVCRFQAEICAVSGITIREKNRCEVKKISGKKKILSRKAKDMLGGKLWNVSCGNRKKGAVEQVRDLREIRNFKGGGGGDSELRN